MEEYQNCISAYLWYKMHFTHIAGTKCTLQDMNIKELRKCNVMHCWNCWIKETTYAGTYKYVFSLIPNSANESCIINENILKQNAFIN